MPGPSSRGARFAVDAERAHQPVPPALGRSWGSDDPAQVWPRWCATEVVAKLTDVPVVMLLRDAAVLTSPHVLDGRAVHWLVHEVDGVVVAHGMSAPTA